MKMLDEQFWFLLVLGIVVLAIVVSGAIFALVGLAQGLSALRAMRGHPNGSSLRLVTLNLLEPSVTIAITSIIVAFSYGSIISPVNLLIWLLIPVIQQSLMLLAPFFAPATLPFRNTIATWGRLRWINTVLLWIIGFASWVLGIGSFVSTMIVIALATSGVVILWLSIVRIVPILRELRDVEQTEPILEP